MCPNCQNVLPKITKKGFFRSKRGRKIQRYVCHACGKYHSEKTFEPGYRLRRYHLRNRIFREFCRGIAQREIAIELRIHHDTVARILKAMNKEALALNEKFRNSLDPKTVVFDELETFEHTKCKPVSIVLAVEEGTRKIVGIEAAKMPAKGRLAKISVKKYGPREDLRPAALRKTLSYLKDYPSLQIVKSDMAPRYPKYVKEILPHTRHITYKGRRGCVVGQGELKACGWDPLFSLNHTAARIRDLIKRLSRRTWCTSKLIPRLQMFLNIFMCHFNKRRLGQKRTTLGRLVRCNG